MNRKRITESVLLVLLVCAAVFAASFFGAHIGAGQHNAEAAAEVSLDPAADTTAGSPRSIVIPGYETLHLKAQQTEQTIYLYNPAENSCIFVISLYLDDIMLFETDPIDPGAELDSIAVLQRLPAGTYEGATLRYSCFDCTEPTKELNGADISLKLEVFP